MTKRGVHLILGLAVMAFAVGNPGVKVGAAHIVVGAWYMNVDLVCDQTVVFDVLLLFFGDGTTEVITMSVDSIMGTWSLSGDSITLQLPTVPPFIFMGTVSGDSIIDGTLEVGSPPVDGCWAATRVEI